MSGPVTKFLDGRARTFDLLPFIGEPISDSTLAMGVPDLAAHWRKRAHLPVEVTLLVVRRDPGVKPEALFLLWLCRRCRVDENAACVYADGFNRECSVPEPVV